MTDQDNETQEDTSSDKEYNFQALRRQLNEANEAKDNERNARLEMEKRLADSQRIEDDDDEDPYVDNKKLKREMARFEKDFEKKVNTIAESKATKMMSENKQSDWLRKNEDFYDVLKSADKFFEHDRELAETILTMPDTFERQKLVYKNIKALGLHKEAPKEPSIQEKIDANRRSPFYQPSGVSNSPYQSTGDYSKEGQKNAYQKMQDLKSRLRIN